jgi:hypothetical protein
MQGDSSLNDARRLVPRLILFQRDDCPLCDQALAVLAAARAPAFDSVWLDGDDALEARFGTRVPVLRNEDDGAELGWPFDAEAVRAFLAP